METNNTKRWQDIKFSTAEELIEAKAQKMHAANLRDGGVFNAQGERISNIEAERGVARARGTTFVHRDYAHLVGLSRTCRYIKHVGWCPA